jgi:hypothetical protein
MEGYDVHGYNFASYCDQLSAESKRLFVAGIDEIAVKVVEIGVVGTPHIEPFPPAQRADLGNSQRDCH